MSSLPVASDGRTLVASHFSISGAGLGEPSRFSLEGRCEAAARAGFTGIGLAIDDFAALCESRRPEQLAAAVDSIGVGVIEIEFVHGWATGTAGAAEREQLALEAAAAFDARHVNVAEFVDAANLPPREVVVERFAALCDRARRHGQARVALEFLPWSGIPDLATAAEIVQASGAPNSCVLVDAYHFHHSRSDLSQLASLRPGLVGVVQLNDGPADPPGGLRAGALDRLPLGAGVFDLSALVRALIESGYDGPWEVELFSDEQHALEVDAAARRAFAGLPELLSACQPS